MSTQIPGAPTASVPAPAQGAAAQVVVVGTGVVGLTAALGCAQLGLSVTLVGPAPARDVPEAGRFDARIYALSPGSQRLLERMRVWPQLDAARLCAVARMSVLGDDGGRLEFAARSAGVERLATICEERALLQALWLGCSLAPGITHRPQAFAAADFDAGAVRVRLDDGSVLSCELLLGADGKDSSVRAAAGLTRHVERYGHTAIVANFAAAVPHRGVARQWFTGDEGIVALLPLPDGQVSLVWSAPTELAKSLMALADDEFAARVALRTGQSADALHAAGPRHAFVLRRLVVDHCVRPGLALLGDAAHVVHPLAGQGLNLGLQDVEDLLRLLAAREPWRALGDNVLLRRYERARAEPVALMRATVGGLAMLFGAQDARVRRLRNVGMSAVDFLAPLKQALVRHAMG